MTWFGLKGTIRRFGVLDGLAWRYAKVAIPFVIAGLAALGNAGCSDGGGENTGGGGSGGAGGDASTSSSSSSSGSGGGSSSSSSSSSSGMMGCGDTQTDPMNCGACDVQCAPGQTCVAGVCTCGMTSVPFADVQTILTNSCTSMNCHSGAMPKAGLDLTAGAAYAALVNKTTSQCNGSRTRVMPNKPEESYLVDKLMGIELCGTSKRMPPLASLPAKDIQTISDWICAGALEN